MGDFRAAFTTPDGACQPWLRNQCADLYPKYETILFLLIAARIFEQNGFAK
jgi:hypothetical protein